MVDPDDEFAVDVGAGDEFMAVRPYLKQIKAPTGYTKGPVNIRKPPNVSVDLEWVHGYRGGNNRNNLAVVSDGCLAYNAAAVGVVYDPKTHTQRFFQGKHTDDITCIAYSRDGSMVATGEMGARDVVKQPGTNKAKKGKSLNRSTCSFDQRLHLGPDYDADEVQAQRCEH